MYPLPYKRYSRVVQRPPSPLPGLDEVTLIPAMVIAWVANNAEELDAPGYRWGHVAATCCRLRPQRHTPEPTFIQ